MRDKASNPPGDDGPRCLVVMYHYVHDADPIARGVIPGLTTKAFEGQLDRLCAATEPIDWPTLYAWTEGDCPLPHRSCLLTFDDGLADHARVVLPILEQRGLRGVFFVPGAVLAEERLLTAHAIHILMSTLGTDRLEEELFRYLADHQNTADWTKSIDEQAARTMYHYEPPPRARLKYFLTVTLPIALRTQAVEALFEEHVGSLRRWARNWYIDWDDLVRMQSAGHTIGTHGFRHEPYLRLTPAERLEDLKRSVAVLRGGLGADLRPLSYPYGSFDRDTCAACRSVGIAHAFTTERSWLDSGSHRLRLPRYDTIHVDIALEEAQPCRQA